jgi:lysophospholipase L1-like esterase
MMRPRSRWRELAFRAAAIAAALLLLEAGLRVAGRPAADACFSPYGDAWLPDDALGFRYRPGASLAGGTVNALGLRGPVPAPAKPRGALRILFVGDSSAYGFGVADDEAFWSLAARAVAAAHPGVAVEPIVGAAPGYSSFHSRVLLDGLLAYRPDHVVFYVGAYNDHRPRVYFRDAEIPARMARRRAVWHRSHALVGLELVANRFARWLDRQRLDAAARARVLPDEFEANLRAMLGAAREAGARTVVLIPPFSAKLRARRPAIPTYEAILRRAAAEEGAAVVELGPLFAAASAEPLYLADQFHPSPAGHRRIAAAIAPALSAGAGAREAAAR